MVSIVESTLVLLCYHLRYIECYNLGEWSIWRIITQAETIFVCHLTLAKTYELWISVIPEAQASSSLIFFCWLEGQCAVLISRLDGVCLVLTNQVDVQLSQWSYDTYALVTIVLTVIRIQIDIIQRQGIGLRIKRGGTIAIDFLTGDIRLVAFIYRHTTNRQSIVWSNQSRRERNIIYGVVY